MRKFIFFISLSLLLASCVRTYKETVYKKVEHQYEIISNIITFETGKAELDDKNRRKLLFYNKILQEYPNLKLRIEAYANSSGKTDKNYSISQQRAANVKNQFVELGVNPERLIISVLEDSKSGFSSENNHQELRGERVELYTMN